jgi:N-6 DNA Methylase
MSTLPTNLRCQLENAIKQARKIAEGGARKALEALAVHEPDPYRHMDEAQRDLRRKLRAQAKQLGDGESQTRRGAYEIKHLVEKLAYDQWHRLLFARFLLENNLLISPQHGVSVSLDDCEELAPSIGLKDAWAVAARFAAKELPEIFRADDPAGAVELPVEDRNPLIHLVTGLPVDVFTASDSLGWCYQFWQAERKDEVNAAGSKIGADELPAVTQLFTEDYMVDFLLDNTLGAWHAGKVLAAKPTLAEAAQSEEELRNAVALPGCPWKYLRFIKAKDGKWTPAAGTFDGWPKTAKELKCLDPCMGSGHFVVAMFERLVALRMTEEKLDEPAAVAAVIRDNLFGLEIDPRCTQIGAFNLALAAWRRVGHCKLPAMNLACSGFAPNAKKEDWLNLAGDSEKLQNGMERLYRLFKDAPVLGSLINPRAAEGDLLEAAFHELQPLLEKALAQEAKDDTAHEMAVTARGLAKAAEILAGQFTLVATNVPYLKRERHGPDLSVFLEINHADSNSDLATAFVERCISFCAASGSLAAVTPQQWLFQTNYTPVRRKLLRREVWESVAVLGEHAFWSSQAAGAFAAVCIFSKATPLETDSFVMLNVMVGACPEEKAELLCKRDISTSLQLRIAASEDAVIPMEEIGEDLEIFGLSASCYQGTSTGDNRRLVFVFWETLQLTRGWEVFLTPPASTLMYGGREHVVRWATIESGECEPAVRGHNAWGHIGIAIGKMRDLPATVYTGEKYSNTAPVIILKDQKQLPALWQFCQTGEFTRALRAINPNIAVENGYVSKISWNPQHWISVAGGNPLPKPFSSDPTQWLFNGHPKGSDQPVHVAVARLLGYQWPRQTGSSFSDCPALDQDGLEKLADKDGIVCLSATKGEAPAAERLRAVLVQALGKFDLSALIASAGAKGSEAETLEEWLRDEFFEQHCALFHHRPFIWHIWDGHKSGFSALVNYHQLTHANLEKLTYAYLGDWIRRQQAAVDAGEAGSDARLQAAKQLQARFKLILEGEPPYDIFVRWKPLSKQAIGWHPDLNDGVRMNIRPFATADILRKRVKIKWEKDRGNEPLREKKDFPWFWGWDEEKQDFAGVGKDPDGNRWNDCHYTNEFKRGANNAR